VNYGRVYKGPVHPLVRFMGKTYYHAVVEVDDDNADFVPEMMKSFFEYMRTLVETNGARFTGGFYSSEYPVTGELFCPVSGEVRKGEKEELSFLRGWDSEKGCLTLDGIPQPDRCEIATVLTFHDPSFFKPNE